MIYGAMQRGHRSLFAAGRRELVEQTVLALRGAGIADIRVIQASRDEGRPDAAVIVGSIQTIAQPRWLDTLPKVQFGVLDEAAHGAASTWVDVLRSQPDARWVGLTATPERADGKPLELFETIVCGPSVRSLTDLGHLVPCRVWAGPADLKPGQLAMTPLEAYLGFGSGDLAAVYCRDIAHARDELAVFRGAGIAADIVTGSAGRGDTPRDEVIARWRAGDIRVVTSVGVLTEGFDLPKLGLAILARRFNHAGQYLQVVGRILRTAPGKTSSTLVDLTGCAHDHGPPDLERIYSLTGKAISTTSRESFGQCLACGSMYVAGPRACPHCGAEIPVRSAPLPRSVGAGVTELGPARLRSEFVVTIASKYRGTCAACGGGYQRGDQISWATVARVARHQRCPAAAQIEP
jgi:superfamily II DNA or RNA helicase